MELMRVVLIIAIITSFLIYVIISPSSFFPQADAKCYGIYCKDDPTKTSSNSTKTKASFDPDSKPTRCYGIHCDGRDSNSTSSTNSNTNPKYGKNNLKQQLTEFNYATNFISIRTSQACEASGTCPNYKVLADQFDNSNKYLSGNFYKNNKTGLWDRHSPIKHNAFEYYKYMNLPWVIFVDPDDYTWDRTKQIIIESQVHYIKRGDPLQYNTRYEHEGLSLDGCRSAVIGWNYNGSNGSINGSSILLDVLNSFYSNCKDPVKFDSLVEIFMPSKIFEGCDKECFYHMEQFKRELQAENLVLAESYEKKTTEKIKCYGIYCDDKDKVIKDTRTQAEKVKDRQKELASINQCNKFQIWDDVRLDGKFRRDKYHCTVQKERDEYMKLIKPEVDTGKINVPDQPFAKEIKLCEDFRKYESDHSDNYSKLRASIVTCDDNYERDEYMQEMNRKYPNGLPK